MNLKSFITNNRGRISVISTKGYRYTATNIEEAKALMSDIYSKSLVVLSFRKMNDNTLKVYISDSDFDEVDVKIYINNKMISTSLNKKRGFEISADDIIYELDVSSDNDDVVVVMKGGNHNEN